MKKLKTTQDYTIKKQGTTCRTEVKWLFAWIIFMTCCCLMPGCSTTGNQVAATQSEISSDQILRIGVQANSPPLIFKKDNKIVGLEADLARQLASSIGKTPEFVELEWKDLIPALLDNKIDIIMAGMSITKARKVRIEFSDPYMASGQMALVTGQYKTKYPIASSIFFANVRVGFEKGTTGDFLVTQKFNYAHKVPFESPEKAVNALTDGRIDMLIHDAPVIWWLASEHETEGIVPINIFLTKEYLAWGIRYDNPELLNAANSFLATWKTDGRLKKTIKKWIPYSNMD